jgi:hypothetical protein
MLEKERKILKEEKSMRDAGERAEDSEGRKEYERCWRKSGRC